MLSEDTLLLPLDRLLLCNTAADQWAGKPAKMKSESVSATAYTAHWLLAAYELTLCFSQKLGILKQRHSCV